MKQKITQQNHFKSWILLVLAFCCFAFDGNAQYLDNLSDAWSKAPTAAYSTRKVMSTYTGPAMRLRRSSDNAETDVFFDTNGWVSLASNVGTAGSGNLLVDWVGVYSAFVTKWYDQSGNGNHATTAVNSGTITVTAGSTSVSGGTTANVNITAFNTELLAGDILYKLDGTTIGTVASNPSSASALTLTSGAAVAMSGEQFMSSAQINTQPRFINGGVIETLPNGRPTLNILNGSNARTANGLTTPITVSSNENVNAFAVPYRTAGSADALIIGNVANYSTANTVNALAFGFNSSTTLGVRNGQVAALTTTLNKSEVVRYYANAQSATKTVGVVSLDANNTTTNVNTNGAYTLTHTRSLNLFRAEGYATRSFTGKCPEIIFYKSTSITTDFNSTDASTILSTQKTKYLDAVVVTPITIQVGASKTYTTIQAAYNSIPTLITDPYIIELQIDYSPASETFPITLAYVRGVSSVNTITIRPASGQSFTISGSSATQLLNLNGAKYVIIDGRAGGVGSTKALTIENTNTAEGASTIYLENDANFNTIKYCTVLGSAASATSTPSSGTIVIAGTNGTSARGGSDPNYSGSGNLNNTIDNCDIANSGSNLPTVGVFFNGNSTYTNESNTISNCNIYNYFNPGAFVSAGIYIYQNTKTTTINANKFYQEVDRTYNHSTGEGVNYGIYTGATATDCKAITNNIIGYSSNTQTGTMTLKGDKNFRFIGISNYRPLTTAYGNTIGGIDITTSSAGISTLGTVCGIYTHNNFPSAIGYQPNVIKDIVVRQSTSTSGTFTLCGIISDQSAALIDNNQIYNLTVIPASDAVVTKLTGIYVNCNNFTFKQNKIYNLSCGSATSTAVHIVNGAVGYAANSSQTIERNLIYNLNATSTGASIITGLTGSSGTAQCTFRNNMIRLGTDVTSNAIIYGLYQNVSAALNLFYYHNSVYIGGQAAGSATQNTFAFYGGGATTTSSNNTLANNIFVNVRTNESGTSAKHCAIRVGVINVIKSSNYNLYWTNNSNTLGMFSTTIKPTLTDATNPWSGAAYTTNDVNSISVDPEFMDPTAATPDLRVMLNSSVVNAVGTAIAAVTDDYFGSTRSGLTPNDLGAYAYTPAAITTSASDYFRTKTTGNWGANTTWLSSTNNTDWASATSAPTSSAASVFIQNGHEVTVAANATASALTLEGGAKLTVNDTYSLNAASLTLQSHETNGTATIKDLNAAGNITVSGTTTTNQYVTTGRNWYVSNPTSAAVLPTVASGTITLNGYSEAAVTDASGATGWQANPSSFDSGKGYVASVSADGNITFTGALNTGNKNIALTSRTGTANKAGFNLVGNPYPSYLDWTAVTDDVNNAAKLRSTTLWYRTKMLNELSQLVYSFWTVNGDGVTVPNGASSKIPPMQSFWVRAVAGVSAPIVVTNAMRSHAPATDKLLKAPAAKNADRTLIRLKVSNGINSDEAVVYFSPKAQDGMDTYDAPKMSNGNASIPEIFTTLGDEKIAINSMNTIPVNNPIGLGFTPGNAGSFSLVANEINNLPENVKLVLKDNATLAETELTANAVYEFAPASVSGDRFSLIFRTSGATTGLESVKAIANVYVNGDNHIVISAPEKLVYSIYNAMGQMIENGVTVSTLQTANCKLQTGVYVVKVGSVSKRVIIK